MKDSLFLPACNSSSWLLHWHIFSNESGPQSLSASLLSCSFVNFIISDLNPTVYKLVCLLHNLSTTLSLCAIVQLLSASMKLCFCWLTHDNHCFASSKCRNLSCYNCHTDSVSDCTMQMNIILYFPGQTKLHHIFNWINQPDAANSQVYYLSFKYSSTCFGHPHAHNQKLQQLQ